MSVTSFSWGSPDWFLPVGVLTAVALLLLVWSYWRSPSTASVRRWAVFLKALAILSLVVCLLEPLFYGVRPRPGANLFVLLADNSESMRIQDAGENDSRGELMRQQLTEETEWRTRLNQDFDVRRYCFDARLRAVEAFSALALDGSSTMLGETLEAIDKRYRRRPLAGVLLWTDGNATDMGAREIDWATLPPVYPVVVGKDVPTNDVSLRRITVSQTNFEVSPVTVEGEITALGGSRQEIVAQLVDASGTKLQEQLLSEVEEGRPGVVRFQFRPESSGVSFYGVRVLARSAANLFGPPEPTPEATLANNSRLVAVDRGGGPYRVLYVSGRPNWEFKFLRRALSEDEEVQLVGLIRIAKREPKFEYRSRYGETTNPLFRGFGKEKDEDAERYDQPVLLRVGTVDDEELRGGFPKVTEELYKYHAIILDDVEAAFFTHDQMTLLREFVSRRGGGFLMLGGQESFVKGKYRRTPIGELLPVYLGATAPMPAVDTGYELFLTRDGWLQPWVRLRATEEEERRRLSSMPAFQTMNRVGDLKPGATALARVKGKAGAQDTLAALTTQRYGRGRSAALMIGDLWKWSLRRKNVEERDLEKAWRQIVRWLVADVPKRVEIVVRRGESDPGRSVRLEVTVRDEEYEPLDNASVLLNVTTPEGHEVQLNPEASVQRPGMYEATYVPRQPGAYRARVAVRDADGSEVGERETGWTAEPAAEEYRAIRPDRALLKKIARESGGEIVTPDDLERFVSSLASRKIPITDPWIYPLWHRWSLFLFAIFCLAGEWGLRRWRGLP